MKKSQDNLFKVASKFQKKYAQAQSLQQIIQNAASSGAKSVNGIMDFPAQLRKDQASLAINITVDTAMTGGYNIDVSPPTVDPPQFAQNYAALPEQIKKYLEMHIKTFPQIPTGTTTLNFSSESPGNGIAQQ